MATVAGNLERLQQTKADIKSALEGKGLQPGDVFSSYAELINQIEIEGQFVWKKYQPVSKVIAGTEEVITELLIFSDFDNNVFTLYKAVRMDNDDAIGIPPSTSIIVDPYDSQFITTLEYPFWINDLQVTGDTKLAYTDLRVASQRDSFQLLGKKITIEKEFQLVGYVVSSDENAYPDGAVHTDEYYYERDKGTHIWEKSEVLCYVSNAEETIDDVTLTSGATKLMQISKTVQFTEDGANGVYGDEVMMTAIAYNGTQVTTSDYPYFIVDTEIESGSPVYTNVISKNGTLVGHRVTKNPPAGSDYTVTEGPFTGYVVDDSAAKYPINGNLAGKYYKKLNVSQIHFSSAEPTAADGADGDIWVKV